MMFPFLRIFFAFAAIAELWRQYKSCGPAAQREYRIATRAVFWLFFGMIALSLALIPLASEHPGLVVTCVMIYSGVATTVLIVWSHRRWQRNVALRKNVAERS
jgi:hypothetical protein